MRTEIGCGGDGHTFPGATFPFGLVQPSPDTVRAAAEDAWERQLSRMEVEGSDSDKINAGCRIATND